MLNPLLGRVALCMHEDAAMKRVQAYCLAVLHPLCFVTGCDDDDRFESYAEVHVVSVRIYKKY